MLLPDNLSGVDLICWLKPGATNPSALRELHRRGATIFDLNGLHAKAYWSTAGGLLGSANLSGLGFQDDGHFEAMVECSPDLFVALEANFSHASRVTSARLLDFEKEHTDFVSRNGGTEFFPEGTLRKKRSFKDWMETPFRTPWRIHVYDEVYDDIGIASKERLAQFGTAAANSWITAVPAMVEERGWVLSIGAKNPASSMQWLHVDFCCSLSEQDPGWEPGTIECIQVFPDDHYVSPFKMEKAIAVAISAALKQLGVKDSDTAADFGSVPTQELLDIVSRNLERKQRLR